MGVIDVWEKLLCVVGDQKEQQPDSPGGGLPGPVRLHPRNPFLLSEHPELPEPKLLHRGVAVQDVWRRWVSYYSMEMSILRCTHKSNVFVEHLKNLFIFFFQLSCKFSLCYRFLRTGSTAKKPKSKPYMGLDMDSSQDNYDELLGLCSGRFQGLYFMHLDGKYILIWQQILFYLLLFHGVRIYIPVNLAK